MINIVALLFTATVFHSAYTHSFLKVPHDCGGGTKMDAPKRRVVVEEHNKKRFFLARGYPFQDNRALKFPTASDMNALYYDCDLENEAFEIAKGCNKGQPDFDYVGSNNKTHAYSHFPFTLIEDAVSEWWNTAVLDGTLVDLTPSEENRKMIPFLQIANGGTNKVGCAYHVCNDDYEYNERYENVEEPFLLFVCTYGDSHIKIGSPLYTEGPLCDSCKDRCIYHQTLCDTESA